VLVGTRRRNTLGHETKDFEDAHASAVHRNLFGRFACFVVRQLNALAVTTQKGFNHETHESHETKGIEQNHGQEVGCIAVLTAQSVPFVYFVCFVVHSDCRVTGLKFIQIEIP